MNTAKKITLDDFDAGILSGDRKLQKFARDFILIYEWLK